MGNGHKERERLGSDSQAEQKEDVGDDAKVDRTKSDNGSLLARQLLIYSGAIVAFMVIQSLAYMYQFALSCEFSTSVKEGRHLAVGLTVALLLAMTLSALVIQFLGSKLSVLMDEFRPLLKQVIAIKIAAVLFFGSMPVIVTVYYGILNSDPSAACVLADARSGVEPNR